MSIKSALCEGRERARESTRERERERVVKCMGLDHASQFDNNYFTEMCSGSEAGSYLRLIDFCASLNSRRESNKEEADHEVKGDLAAERFWHLRPGGWRERESALLTAYWSESTLSS